LRDHGIKDERVLAALGEVPRERFVPEEYRRAAFEDRALPIDSGQTISQPYMVALMTQELAMNGTETILEIGTGSGYQAAVLSPLVKEVYSIEIVPELGNNAKRNSPKLSLIYNVPSRSSEQPMMLISAMVCLSIILI
jgi:protein-L-isoaspartate(D-aspartate) O-methyltransferase